MGFIDSVKGLFETKQPNFTVTPLSSFQEFTRLTTSDELLDQYFGWTYKAIKTKADALVTYKAQLFQQKKQEKIELVEQQIQRDLARFNSFMTLTDARRLTYTHKMLVGAAYWLLVDSEEQGHKFDFFVLDPTKISVITDKFGIPSGYRYQDPDGGEQIIDKGDIVAFRETNPKNWLNGYSQVYASRFSHNSWELASKFNMNMFANSGRPDGFLIAEGISETERQRLESRLKAKYFGTDNARKVGVSNGKLEFMEITKAQRELDFVEGTKMLRDEILSLHGVPKPLVGLTDSTFNNSAEAQRVFQRYTLLPELTQEQDVLNEQLVDKYYTRTVRNNLVIFFEFPSPVEADTEKEAAQASLLWEKGVMTRNEARRMVGLDDVEGGEEFRVDQNPLLEIAQRNIDDTQKTVRTMEKKITEMQDIFNRTPDAEAVLEETRKDMKDFFFKQNKEKEATMVGLIVKYFEDQEKRLLDSIKEVKQPSLKIDIDLAKENSLFFQLLEEQFLAVGIDFTNIANDLLSFEPEDRLPMSTNTRKLINDSVSKIGDDINKVTKERIEKIIIRSVQEEAGITEVKKQIQDLFEGFIDVDNPTKQSRAETIARTSTNFIKNEAMQDVFKRSGIEQQEWLSAKDADVRFDHVIADGQIRPINEKFDVGGEALRFPGDPNGSPGNIINCRCTLIPVI